MNISWYAKSFVVPDRLLEGLGTGTNHTFSPELELPQTNQQHNKQAGQAIYMFLKLRSCRKWPTLVASLMLITCLVLGIIQR